jgi:hypothetical protein
MTSGRALLLLAAAAVQLTMPLEPTVREEPSQDRGARPVEYTTDAEQETPGTAAHLLAPDP